MISSKVELCFAVGARRTIIGTRWAAGQHQDARRHDMFIGSVYFPRFFMNYSPVLRHCLL